MTIDDRATFNLRLAKRLCKRYIRRSGLKVVKTIKKLFIVKDKPNFICSRWYTFTVASENHPEIDLLIEEQL